MADKRPPIYVVAQKAGIVGRIALVRATTKAQVTQFLLDVHVASQDEIIEMRDAGFAVLDATAEPEPPQGEPPL